MTHEFKPVEFHATCCGDNNSVPATADFLQKRGCHMRKLSLQHVPSCVPALKFLRFRSFGFRRKIGQHFRDLWKEDCFSCCLYPLKIYERGFFFSKVVWKWKGFSAFIIWLSWLLVFPPNISMHILLSVLHNSLTVLYLGEFDFKNFWTSNLRRSFPLFW